MIQPPHSVNLSGLNHRETSRRANIFLNRGNRLAGRYEGETCNGAVVIAKVLPGCDRRNKVLPHRSFPQHDTNVCKKCIYPVLNRPLWQKFFSGKKNNRRTKATVSSFFRGRILPWLMAL